MAASITVSPEEFAAGSYKPETLEQALAHYDKAGYLELEHSFDPAFIQELQQAHQADYGHLTEEQAGQTSLNVGKGRFMTSLALKPPFLDARLYANPFVLRLMEAMLGPGFLINSITCVTAWPGAKNQHLHADFPALFTTPEIDPKLDPYAITVAIPLINLDEKTGTTAMLPGTHKTPPGTRPDILDLPYAQQGSCYLMDYRLRHYGTENHTDRLRPIIYIIYSRPWFIDSVNFSKQPPIRVNPRDLARLQPQHLSLFKRVIDSTNHTLALL
ncbi:phytanoyl-CoA dioxygenase family protein [Hyalangium gracile]|uniref:phytanoyl-CoA dioxygenase family protein n=1 Tax=Hyalangium gracile TaxID=394092 RepID=UPI001CC9936B|nr:phytanoyl-CoA dioxygenase family protein [Hyalangium gracile]